MTDTFTTVAEAVRSTALLVAKLVALFVPGVGLAVEALGIAEQAVAPADEVIAGAKAAFALIHTDPVAGVAAARTVVATAETTMVYNPSTRSWRPKA